MMIMKEADAVAYLRHPNNRERVEGMIAGMREGHRHILRRYYLDSRTVKQIAEECGMPEHRISATFTAANRALIYRVKTMPAKVDTKDVESRVFKQPEQGEGDPKYNGTVEHGKTDSPVEEPKARRPYKRRQRPEVGESARAEFSLPLPQEVELVVRVKIIVEVVQQ